MEAERKRVRQGEGGGSKMEIRRGDVGRRESERERERARESEGGVGDVGGGREHVK